MNISGQGQKMDVHRPHTHHRHFCSDFYCQRRNKHHLDTVHGFQPVLELVIGWTGSHPPSDKQGNEQRCLPTADAYRHYFFFMCNFKVYFDL